MDGEDGGGEEDRTFVRGVVKVVNGLERERSDTIFILYTGWVSYSKVSVIRTVYQY